MLYLGITVVKSLCSQSFLGLVDQLLSLAANVGKKSSRLMQKSVLSIRVIVLEDSRFCAMTKFYLLAISLSLRRVADRTRTTHYFLAVLIPRTQRPVVLRLNGTIVCAKYVFDKNWKTRQSTLCLVRDGRISTWQSKRCVVGSTAESISIHPSTSLTIQSVAPISHRRPSTSGLFFLDLIEMIIMIHSEYEQLCKTSAKRSRI